MSSPRNGRRNWPAEPPHRHRSIDKESFQIDDARRFCCEARIKPLTRKRRRPSCRPLSAPLLLSVFSLAFFIPNVYARASKSKNKKAATPYASCLQSLKQADSNGDGKLDATEFLSSIQLMAPGIDATKSVTLPTALQSTLMGGGLDLTDATSCASLCDAIYVGILAAAGRSATPQSCNMAFKIADMGNSDDYLSQEEFARFASRLSNGAVSYTAPMSALPLAVQSIFPMFADPTTDTINIMGGKTQDTTATADQKAFALNLCRQTTVAFILSSTAAPASTTTATASATRATSGAGRHTSAPVSTAAAAQTSTGGLGGRHTSAPVSTAAAAQTSTGGLGGRHTSAPVSTAAGAQSSTGGLGGRHTSAPTQAKAAPAAAAAQYSFTTSQCRAAFALSDMSRDNFLDQSEYFRFIYRVSGGKMAASGDFSTLPQTVQEAFAKLATDNGDGTKISIAGGKTGAIPTAEQEASIEQICTATEDAMNGGSSTSTGTKPTAPATTATPPAATPSISTPATPSTAGSPTTSGGAPVTTFAFTFTQCKTAFALSDRSRDDFLDQSEYLRFVERLSNNYWVATGEFSSLPQPLQDNYSNLATTNGDGTNISVEGGKPGQTATAEQQTSLQEICTATQEAMNAAVGGGSTPVASKPPVSVPSATPPGSTPTAKPPSVAQTLAPTIVLDIGKCKQAMALADLSRDSLLNQDEYVRFLSRQDASISITTKFADLPQALQDNFNTLAAETGDAATIDITGSRPGSTVDATQEAYLEHVCKATNQAINGGSANVPPGTSPVTQPPASSPGNTIPGGSPTNSTLGNIPVYNAFVLLNSDGLGAVSLLSGPNRRALTKAYGEFVNVVVNDFVKGVVPTTRNGGIFNRLVDTPSAGQRSLVVRGHRTRRLGITGLVNGSIDIFDLVDSPCPAGVTGVCISVYAEFEVSSEGVSYNESVLTNYAQDAVLKNNLLDSLLEAADPAATIHVVNITDIRKHENPGTGTPSTPPSRDPEPPIYESVDNNKQGGHGGIIAMVSVIAVAALVGGIYYLVLVQKKARRKARKARAASGKKTTSDKTVDNASDGDDAEAEPGAKNDFDFSQNSDVESEGGGKNLFASPENSEVDEDEEEGGGFNVHEQSPERNRIRHGLAAGLTSGLTRGTGIVTTGLTKGTGIVTTGLTKGTGIVTKGTGTVLTTFNTLTGGVAGNLAHGVQRGVQTVGGEVLKGAKTVGQTVQTVGQKTLDTGVLAAGTVGNVGLGLVGTATGGLIGKKRGFNTEGEDEEMAARASARETDENLEDCANYEFDDPDEMKHNEFDPFVNSSDELWKTAKDGNSDDDSWGENSDRSKGFFGSNDDDDDSESESGLEKATPDDAVNRSGISILPESMRHFDAMVDKGDWDEVMETAAEFEDHIDIMSASSGETNDEAELFFQSESDASSSSSVESDGGEHLDDDVDKASLSSDDLKRRDQYKKQVEALVRQYVPDEIDNVDTMLDQFAGREDELLKTLQTMSERTNLHRARRAVHRSKGIPDRENRTFAAGGTDGSAAIAAASTIGGAAFSESRHQTPRYGDGEEFSMSRSGTGSYAGSQDGNRRYYDEQQNDNYSEGGSRSQGSGSYGQESGSYGDAGDGGGGFDADDFGDGGSFQSGSGTYDDERSASYGDASGSYDDEHPDSGFNEEIKPRSGTYEGDTPVSPKDHVSGRQGHQSFGSYGDELSGSYGDENDDGQSGSYGLEQEDEQFANFDFEHEDAQGDDRSGSYDDDGRSGSYDDQERSGSYGEDDGPGSFHDDQAAGHYDGKSHDHEEGPGGYGDEASYDPDDRPGSYHDDQAGREKLRDRGDEGSGSYGDEGSYDDPQGDGPGSYHDAPASGHYDEQSHDRDDEGSGSYGDEGSYDDPQDVGPGSYHDAPASGHYDEKSHDRDDDGSGSYGDEGSYDDPQGDGPGSYHDARASGHYDEKSHDRDDEGSGSYGDEASYDDPQDDRPGSYHDGQASGRYDKKSHDPDDEGSGSYGDEASYDDTERVRPGSYHDDLASARYDDKSYDRDDEGSGSYGDEGSYDGPEVDHPGSHHDNQGSGRYDEKSQDHDDEGSYSDEGSYDDLEADRPGSYHDDQASGSYDEKSQCRDDDEASGSYGDEGSYDDAEGGVKEKIRDPKLHDDGRSYDDQDFGDDGGSYSDEGSYDVERSYGDEGDSDED